MVSVTVNDLDEVLEQRLRLRAAGKGVSIEQEVKNILRRRCAKNLRLREIWLARFAPGSRLLAAWNWNCRSATLFAPRPGSAEAR